MAEDQAARPLQFKTWKPRKDVLNTLSDVELVQRYILGPFYTSGENAAFLLPSYRLLNY